MTRTTSAVTRCGPAGAGVRACAGIEVATLGHRRDSQPHAVLVAVEPVGSPGAGVQVVLRTGLEANQRSPRRRRGPPHRTRARGKREDEEYGRRNALPASTLHLETHTPAKLAPQLPRPRTLVVVDRSIVAVAPRGSVALFFPYCEALVLPGRCLEVV